MSTKGSYEKEPSAGRIVFELVVGNLATLILWLIYMVNRILRTPFWWSEIANFKTWKHAPVSMVKTHQVLEAQKWQARRNKDTMIVVILGAFYTLNLFVNWWWFFLITSIVLGIVAIVVTGSLIRVRRRRIKKEIEEAEQESF